MLGHLAQCIAAFHNDLGERMNKTLLLVMSEFGRTVAENGAMGTDHGFGGFMLAVGGKQLLSGTNRGVGIMGQHKSLADLKDGRYQLVTTDFRTVYAEALDRLFGFDSAKSKIFPAYKLGSDKYLNFMRKLEQA
jgi:uncharacterized protein (DUF1501 family)